METRAVNFGKKSQKGPLGIWQDIEKFSLNDSAIITEHLLFSCIFLGTTGTIVSEQKHMCSCGTYILKGQV